ncbi:hypothetical protein H0X09_00710 [Candidatus Saccharibacteria bacterium]|nr:hypothetical protein [Candidatus Saccharibacteria bacterium]
MNLKKQTLIAFSASTLAIVGLATAGSVWAETSATPKQDGIITKIAQKFNLNEDDVKAVFDEHKAAQKAEREKSFEQRLNQAVTDGKITSEQKSKIIAKQKELKTYFESIKDKPREEKHELMEAKKIELRKWAVDNNIPKEYLQFGGVKAGPGGLRHKEMHNS